MSCDDYCEFFMNLEPGKTDNKTQLLKVRYASNFRDYWRYTDNQNRTSDWVTLTKGEPYYIETLMREDGSGDHLSVAVEIEQTSIVNHHHAMKEIQQLSIDIENNKDTSRITIDKPDGG
jgi:frataxin-like iron-binding protein CyaY